MNLLEKHKKRNRLIRRSLCGLLVLYLIAAIAPYLFVPEAPEIVAAAAMIENSVPAGDRAALLSTGEEALGARLNLIANAQHSLALGTYLFAKDESGHAIAAALLDAADRGVAVRVLTDGLIGGVNLLGSELGYALGAHPNIELRFYNPVNVLAPWGLNARYHEKFVLADERIFLLGGRNISDEFLTVQGHPRYNYDMDVLVYRDSPAAGSAASALLDYFNGIWNTRCTPQYETTPGYREKSVNELLLSLKARYEALKTEHAQAMSPTDWNAKTVPIDGFALLTNPTVPTVKQPVLWTELIGLMRSANERVWIQTPYLVLNAPMQEALSNAAALPTEMVVLTNSRASGNNIAASADLVFHKGDITRMDMELFEFQGDHSMHTKSILIDDDLSLFGSFNFDVRSAYIATELVLVVKSEALNSMLEAHMLEMRDLSLPVENGGYGENGDVQIKEIPWYKELMIYVASPFVALVRFCL